jgi:hypothetical protein
MLYHFYIFDFSRLNDRPVGTRSNIAAMPVLASRLF